MKPKAYYNEYDPYAADWLRNLIRQGHIADGEVDSRSIVDVGADDLRGFTQCHFFAGIGVWSHALRLAGWTDDRPVWTGSCPCQPFSAAGKGKGFEDERHLWPVFHRLIAECRPPVVFGEQVASKDGLGWLDAVCADMEASGYAIGAADLCAAGVGAPHIRQRLWFVGERLEHATRDGREERRAEPGRRGVVSGCCDSGLADPDEGKRGRLADGEGRQRDRAQTGRQQGNGEFEPGGATGGLGDHHHPGLEGQRSGHQAESGRLGAIRPVAEAGEPRGLADTDGGDAGSERLQRSGQQRQQPEDGGALHGGRPRPTNGIWRDADWLFCRDGKWRPVEPGTFPLAHGAPARVGRLRAYGNAIVAQAAAQVIGAYMEI